MPHANEPLHGEKKRGIRSLFYTCLRRMMKATKDTDSAIPSPPEQPSWSLYQSIDKLPLTIFIKCAVDADFSALILSGEPPTDAVDAAWLHLYSDYCDRVGGIHISSLINKSKALNALASKVDRIRCLVEVARVHPCIEVADALKADGYRVDINASEEDYHRQLDVILARLKPDYIRLDRMNGDISDGKRKKPVTARDFSETLTQCSIFVKFHIDANQITTGEYCNYIRSLQEHIDANKPKRAR